MPIIGTLESLLLLVSSRRQTKHVGRPCRCNVILARIERGYCHVFPERRITNAFALAQDFRATDGHHRHCAAACHHPSITKLYFTHSQHASGQSLTTWAYLCCRKSVVGHVWIAESEAFNLYRQHYRIGDELTDGEWHPAKCWLDLLRFGRFHLAQRDQSLALSYRKVRDRLV